MKLWFRCPWLLWGFNLERKQGHRMGITCYKDSSCEAGCGGTDL
ncbi:rCG29826 [Rattus norvegicus]|uniref:RCG29826 n=1 Tax=Rattus norvegicus TaxID=10116 RepID=A6IMD8_RAT|nr:rCG29826 [Rattus norvegicus]